MGVLIDHLPLAVGNGRREFVHGKGDASARELQVGGIASLGRGDTRNLKLLQRGAFAVDDGHQVALHLGQLHYVGAVGVVQFCLAHQEGELDVARCAALLTAGSLLILVGVEGEFGEGELQELQRSLGLAGHDGVGLLHQVLRVVAHVHDERGTVAPLGVLHQYGVFDFHRHGCCLREGVESGGDKPRNGVPTVVVEHAALLR